MKVTLRFYEGLNVFLNRDHHNKRFSYYLKGTTSIKDLIESCGVPHPEVDVILINGMGVDFHYHLLEEDRIEVYPVLPDHSFENACHLQKRPLDDHRFIADGHLGKLTRYLRLLGFDVAYSANADDSAILNIMQAEERALLTRDRRLLMHKVVRHGYCPRSDQPIDQLLEVIQRFGLDNAINPFSHCLNCNGLLQPVDKSEILNQLEPLTRQYYDSFARCESCENIYWQGSHYDHLAGLINKIQGQ